MTQAPAIDLIDSPIDLDLPALIGKIVDQDQSAFSTLFKATSARVHGLAYRVTGCVQLAEEVTEDTFFQVWRQAPRFDPTRGTAMAWIMTIARSRALDAWRSAPPFDSQPDYEVDSGEQTQSQDAPPDLLSAIEQTDQLHAALASLDALPRQLVALAFFRGLSHDEIATTTGLPLGTVKSHIRRALAQLKAALNPTQPLSISQ